MLASVFSPLVLDMFSHWHFRTLSSKKLIIVDKRTSRSKNAVHFLIIASKIVYLLTIQIDNFTFIILIYYLHLFTLMSLFTVLLSWFFTLKD